MKLHPSFCAPEAIFLLAGMVYGSVRDTEFDNSIGLELWTSEALGVLGQILFPWTNGWPFSHSPPRWRLTCEDRLRRVWGSVEQEALEDVSSTEAGRITGQHHYSRPPCVSHKTPLAPSALQRCCCGSAH